MTIFDLTKTVRPVLKKYGVIRASFFGSYVRNEMTPKSDIDVLVELPKDIHGLDYIGLRLDLKSDLEKALERKVDVVEYRLVKPLLKKYILSQQVPII